MSLAWDTRDDDVRSTRGGLLRAVYGIDEARTQQDSDYTHASLEVQRFLDLYRGTRILSLRAFTGAVWADDFSRLPFTELERTGGRFGLRGYPKLRFADARQFVLSAEYLYRATALVRGKVFVDWGSVAGNFESLRPFATDPSIGVGLDVGRHKRVSLQAAWSPEGIEFSFGSDTLFSERTRREQ
jgi:outer membrane protein assembly factor BamA